MFKNIKLSRNHWLLLCLCMTGIVTSGCKKQTGMAGDFASLKIIGIFDLDLVMVANFGGKDLPQYENARSIGSVNVTPELLNNYVYQSPQPLWFHAYPDTMPGDKPVMALSLELEKGAAYSLFVTGPRNNLDTFLLKDENPPYNTTDSVTNVRFVNMMRSQPVSVNLKGQPHGSLAANIPYKGHTGFTSIPLSITMEELSFEFRDAATGELLIEQTASPFYTGGTEWLFKYRTLVPGGIKGTSGPTRPRVIWYNSF